MPDNSTLLMDADLSSLSGAESFPITINSGNKCFGLTDGNKMSCSSDISSLFKITGGSLTLVNGEFQLRNISSSVIVIDGGTFTMFDGVTISGEGVSSGIQLNSGKLNIKGGIFTGFNRGVALIVNGGDVDIIGATINSNYNGVNISGGSGTIKNLKFINNSILPETSRVYITGGEYEFENCTIDGNYCGSGSGKDFLGLVVRVGGGTVSFNNCSISNNHTQVSGDSDVYGVGAYITGGTVSFVNCAINDNYITIQASSEEISRNNYLYGVGIYAEQEEGKTTNLTISNTTISGNSIATTEGENVTMGDYQSENPHDGIQYFIKAGVNYNGAVLTEDVKQN